MHITNNGSEGLSILEQCVPFDVVVSNLLMPNQIGVEFLTQVMEYHPDTVRVLYTGYRISS